MVQIDKSRGGGKALQSPTQQLLWTKKAHPNGGLCMRTKLNPLGRRRFVNVVQEEKFTVPGSHLFKVPKQLKTLECHSVGGGGSGGTGGAYEWVNGWGGGGGSGGMAQHVFNAEQILELEASTINITVGAGGLAPQGGNAYVGVSGNDGQPSKIQTSLGYLQGNGGKAGGGGAYAGGAAAGIGGSYQTNIQGASGMNGKDGVNKTPGASIYGGFGAGKPGGNGSLSGSNNYGEGYPGGATVKYTARKGM